MDRLTKYRQLIKSLLAERCEIINRQPLACQQTFCVFDDERAGYLLLTVGWSGHQRVQGISLFLRICGEKIWIEEDLTEEGIALRLLDAGVPRDDIVLGFQPPEMRPLTEFAVA
jgi:hypothetical protein